MAKPILLVGIPVEDATQDRLDALVLGLERKFNNEYYVISYTTVEMVEPKFNVLNASDVNPKQIGKLRAEVLEIVKSAQVSKEKSRIISLP